MFNESKSHRDKTTQYTHTELNKKLRGSDRQSLNQTVTEGEVCGDHRKKNSLQSGVRGPQITGLQRKYRTSLLPHSATVVPGTSR